MKIIKNLKIKNKLFFMGGVLGIALIIVGILGYYYLDNTNQKIKSMYSEKLLSIQYLETAQANYNDMNRCLFELMMTTDKEKKQELEDELEAYQKVVEQNLSDYVSIKSEKGEDTEKVDSLVSYLSGVNGMISPVINYINDDKTLIAFKFYQNGIGDINSNVKQIIDVLVQEDVAAANEMYELNYQEFKSARVIMMGIIALAIVIGIIVTAAIILLITKPIKEIKKYLQMISNGDLSEDSIQVLDKFKNNKDETGDLSRAIIQMRQNLWMLIAKVSEVAEQIAASSEELNASVEESSRGIEETSVAVNSIASEIENQFNTIQETSNSMQEVKHNTEQVVANIIGTSKITTQAIQVTGEGETTINVTKEQMGNIEKIVTELDHTIQTLGDRSNTIGNIVEVISSIAEQTNLLALNAAIEAARAGEHGKGFAVVADEIRKLAENSKTSTNKITDLINEIQSDVNVAVVSMDEGTKQVQVGIEVVDKAGQKFKEISNLVQEVTTQVEEISVASESIEKGSKQVVAAMEKVDEVSMNVSDKSETIAANIEEQSSSMNEISSSSESLAQIGGELMNEISKFKLS